MTSTIVGTFELRALLLSGLFCHDFLVLLVLLLQRVSGSQRVEDFSTAKSN